MLPSPLTIAPVGAITAASPAVAIGDGRQAAFQRALQSLVGQSVTGEVLSRFNDGSFMVNVAEHAVRMQLPADASVGSRLPLTVLSAEPRATFELSQPSSSVVLYGEAHVPAGTGDLYSPADARASGQPAATGMAGNAATGAAGSSSASATGQNNAGTLGTAGAAAAQSALSAAADGAADGATQTASARPPAQALLAASPAGSAAQQAGMAAAYPALAAGAAASRNAAAAVSAAGAALPSGEDEAASGTTATTANTATTATIATTSSAGSAAAAASANASAAASQSSRAHSAAASLLGKAPLTPATQLPGLDAGTSQPELSTAARILGSLLSQPAAASALPLLGKTALFSQGAPEPSQLAQTLQNTIEESGLFYESHVAAWSRGERSLEQLQREPQMQQARAQSAPAADTPALPDRAAAQQINQQLLAHEQGRVQWQGEAWPGQPMQWEIRRQSEREAGGRNGGEQAATPVWRSNLRLRFATLGELNASITMVGQQIHLQLQTDDSASGATLRAQAGVLEQAMAAAGIPLSSCQINDGDTNDG